MRTHSGTIKMPIIRSEIVTVTARELAYRQAIERRHEGDDGTETHYDRQHGDRREYASDLPDPISDASPIHVLAYYGLATREIELLDRHDCETVGDVRAAMDGVDCKAWFGLEQATREKIADAVGMVPR
jgi:hypothetical protein